MDASVEMIEEHVKSKFKDLIDLTDLSQTIGDTDRGKHIRTRSLAAYAVQKLANVSESVAAAAVTDGGQDKGIDAVIFNAGTKTLYIVQSKFPERENAGVDKGDILVFLDGVEQLFKLEFAGFNGRVKSKELEIEKALSDASIKVSIIYISSGGPVGGESLEPIERFVETKNSHADEDWLDFVQIPNERVRELIASDKSAQDVDLEVSLLEWGLVSKPHRAFYGQVSAAEIGEWYKEYGKNIVSENIRSYLGTSTDVNKKIANTLTSDSNQFFYMNNGITAICDSIEKTNKFADARTAGTFQCKNIKIINGAQTYGTIGKTYSTEPEAIKDAWVLIRLVSIKSNDSELKHKVTVATNSQNAIQLIDFASMETQQVRLEKELLKDHGIKYIRLREDQSDINPIEDITMAQAASALACFESDVKICTNHKREINKIWDDLKKTPYTTLFNAGASAKKAANSVAAWKRLSNFIKRKNLKRGREDTYSKSGDHFLMHMIFEKFDNKMARIQNTPEDFKIYLDDNFETIANDVYDKIKAHLDANYGSVQLGRFFISSTKVADLKTELQTQGVL